MRLGAPVFVQTEDPEELARAHRALGLRAAYCPEIALTDTDRIRATEAAFAKHDVVIAEVGVWNNLMEFDDTKRKANLKAMKEGLALADEVGARCAVNIAGTLSDTAWDGPHPGNLSEEAFEIAVMNARDIIRAVKPKRAVLTYEMMPWSLPDGPDSYLALLEAVDRPEFGVHLDVVNIISSVRRYYYNTDVIRECFEKLGEHIVCCHLKDITLRDQLTVHLDECLAGTGGLDIKTYLQEASQLPQDAPVLLEHLKTPEEYDQARRYVQGVMEEVGIRP